MTDASVTGLAQTMEVDDFVETSDVEELQELEQEGRRALSSSRQRHGSFSPRKRVKVLLVVCVSSLTTYISSKLYHGSLNDDETMRAQSRSQLSSTTLKPISPVWLPSCSTSQPSDANFQSQTSQDPLLYSPMHALLSSPVASILLTKRTSISSSGEQDQIAVTFNSSTTPTNSPPTHLCRLSSPELHSPPKSPVSTRNLHKDDELLLCIPVKSVDLDRTSSPLTPSTPKSLFSDTVDRDIIHDLSQSPFQDLPALSVSPGSPLQALPPPEAPGPPEVIQELLDGPRYPLRRRKAAQLKPYTVDQLKYKQALKANPDAIVKFKNLALRNHHHHPEDRYEEDGETQKDAYIDDDNNDEDGDWEERERRQHQRREDARRKEISRQALSERQQISYPEILQDLSSTDEEEANEKHTLSKEARKIVKERERQWEIQKREERRREQEQRRQQLLKPKPFPTVNRKLSNAEAPTDDRSTLEDVCYFYANVSILFSIFNP